MKYSARQVTRGLMLGVTLMVGVTLSPAPSVQAADYPSRDITFINPFAPGGSTDPVFRQFVVQLEKVLQGSVNVVNKPGGSATIGIGAVVLAKPDGYTIGLGTNSALIYEPMVTSSGLAYKTLDDYQPIVKMVAVPSILTVRADAPWKTFGELMDHVRKNPGKVRASSAGMGTSTNLGIYQLNKVAGVKIVPVPFSGGGGEAMIALLGGRVEACVSTGLGPVGQIKAGKARALAVFRKGTYELLPDATPTVDAGYDVTLESGFYVIAPKGLPKDVLDKIVPASMQVVRSEEFRNFARVSGYVLDAKGPEEVRAELFSQIKMFSDLIAFLKQK